MHRPAALVALVLLPLAGCTGGATDDQAVDAAERSVEADADRLADKLEPLCARTETCPKVRAAGLADALSVPLGEGNRVTFYDGRHFDVRFCVANEEHEVWAWYHSEEGTETRRGGKPCTFS